jgi:rhodanese-related sulfurtransferase
MYRRSKERRHHRRRDTTNNSGRTLTSAFRRPAAQVAVLAVVALIIYLILQAGNGTTNNTSTTGLPKEISVSEASDKYQKGAFFIDVRTQEEWNEYHVPNTSLVPLDQLPNRLNELPKDKEIVVVCRSGNRSQQGRDILLNAGFTQVTSMTGGLNEWRASGYPIEP